MVQLHWMDSARRALTPGLGFGHADRRCCRGGRQSEEDREERTPQA